jgi:Fur family ferric uptake transcriptional regulator
MVAYVTRQRETLETYLRSLAGEHISAEKIVEHFAKTDKPIGRATVYRCLQKLERDGLIQRYVPGARQASCFQYVGVPEKTPEHFHLQCECCGTLQHVECHTLGEMEEHIRQSHDFSVNPLRTVLYGVCHDCMTGKEKGGPDGGPAK